MRSTATTAGANALAQQYNDLRKDAYGGAMLLTHEQGTPGMTLYIEPGACYVGATRVIYAGGNSPSITNPVTNPRIDLITIDSAGTIGVTAGSEAASPVAPAYPANLLVLAEVYLRTTGTTIRDTDQGSGHYIKNDVRPFLGGAYIASDAQVDAAASISFSKLNYGSIGVAMLPTTTDTTDFGSSSKQWNNLYAKTIYQNGALLATSKFGGDGSDGALAITSGTTTIALGGAQVVVKNYSSISITGTGKLAFSGAHASGTVVILLSKGNVTLTSSTVPLIEVSNIGASAGTAGTSFGLVVGGAGNGGAGGSGAGSGGAGGPGGSGGGTYTQSTIHLYAKAIFEGCGAGGGAGGAGGQNIGGNGSGGAGGAGGGALYIECGGALNFTGTIYANGSNGTAGTNGTAYAGGGGGGGAGGNGGGVIILYNTLTANSGTISVTGGAGAGGGAGFGSGYSPGSGGGGGGGSGGAVSVGNTGTTGAAGGGSSGGAGGAGASGLSGFSLVAKNIAFA